MAVLDYLYILYVISFLYPNERYLLNGMIMMACFPTTTTTGFVLSKAAGGNEFITLFNATLANVSAIFVSPGIAILLSIHPSIHPSHLSIHLSIYPSTHLSISFVSILVYSLSSPTLIMKYIYIYLTISINHLFYWLSILALLSLFLSASAEVPVVEVITNLCITVLIPLLSGQIFRRILLVESVQCIQFWR